jgi:hypothetical protein
MQYTFFGKIHPERYNVSIPGVEMKMRFPENGIEGVLRCYIEMSQVSATFQCDEPVANVHTLKNYVEDAIRVALDALGYVLGYGYDLEVTQMTDSEGSRPVVFGVGIPAVKNSAETAGISLDNVIELQRDYRGEQLQRCLSDLREAVRSPKDTGFFCYRAVEALRQFFVCEKGAKDDKSSWEMLRSDLDVVKSDIDKIRDVAKPVRHGGGVLMTDEQRAEIFTLTWDIVNKFILYGLNGYQKT